MPILPSCDMSASVATDNVPMAPPPNSRIDGLTAGLGTLNLVESNQDGLSFSPPDGFRRSAIPRYLFRVYAPKTAASTTLDRVESVSAVVGAPSSRTCLFDLDKSTAADMVDKHLQWEETSAPDNLVSWTSSLWTALLYIFYRHAHDSALFGDIYLYIVDTSKFSDKTFMCDLDLIRAFKDRDRRLSNLWGLRHKPRGGFWSGSYYFGEYLTQGSLSLEGKCARVTAKEMMNNGLPELQPRFDQFAAWDRNEAGWAKLVVELREPFYAPPAEDVGERRVGPNDNDASIMRRIGNLFGVGWRAPVALALFSLAPNRTGAVDLLFGFENDGPPWGMFFLCSDKTLGKGGMERDAAANKNHVVDQILARKNALTQQKTSIRTIWRPRWRNSSTTSTTHTWNFSSSHCKVSILFLLSKPLRATAEL